MNFGYETKGATALNTGKFFASRFIIPDAGVLSSVSVYLKNAAGSAQNVQVGIYNDNAGTLGTKLIASASVSIPDAFDNWKLFNLSANLNLGGAYWLTTQLQNSAAIVYLYSDAGTTSQKAFVSAWVFGSWVDDPPGLTYSDFKISIFATYTPVSPSAYSWAQMPKSQIEAETIEEAIERIVQEHDDDATAHLGTDQSLEAHKSADIIDHLADSIIEDKIGDGEVSIQKLTATHRIIISAFESLDGWLSGGTKVLELGSLTLKTANTTNAYAYACDVPSGIVGLDWDKDFFWQATIKLAQITNQEVYFGFGGSAYVGGYSGAGFKISNGTLYCYHWDLVLAAVTYITSEIAGITLTVPHVYRIFYDQSAGTLEFYIDGVLKHTFTSGLPTADSDELALFQIKTLENAYKYLYIFDLLISIPK